MYRIIASVIAYQGTWYQVPDARCGLVRLVVEDGAVQMAGIRRRPMHVRQFLTERHVRHIDASPSADSTGSAMCNMQGLELSTLRRAPSILQTDFEFHVVWSKNIGSEFDLKTQDSIHSSSPHSMSWKLVVLDVQQM